MRRRNVIHHRYLPTRFPLSWLLIAWLLLDRYHAPGWVHGIVWTLLGLATIGCLVNMSAEEPVAPGTITDPGKEA